MYVKNTSVSAVCLLSRKPDQRRTVADCAGFESSTFSMLAFNAALIT